MTDGASILSSDHGPYAVITINRPAQLNRMTGAVIAELKDAIDSFRCNQHLLSLIITGAGGIFSVGADLGEVAALDPITAYDFSRSGQALLASLGDAAPVTIAAIDGYCLGGGLDIALSCDLRYATPRSSFQHPGAKRGIITGWGGTQRLPRSIGADAARRMLITGERIDAAEAQRTGLINRVCDDAPAYAVSLAKNIAEKFTREELVMIKAAIFVRENAKHTK